MMNVLKTILLFFVIADVLAFQNNVITKRNKLNLLKMANTENHSPFSNWRKKFGKLMVNLAFTNLLFNNPSYSKAIELSEGSVLDSAPSIASGEKIVIELPSMTQISESVERIKKGLPSADKITESLEQLSGEFSSNIGNLKDVTNLKDFHFNVPQASNLLTTTKRTVDVAAGSAVDVVDQVRNSLSSIHITVPPLVDASTILPDLHDIDLKKALTDWRVLSGAVALVIFSDTVQYGKQMARYSAEKEEQLKELTNRLSAAANETENFLALQSESAKLQEDIDYISLQFEKKCQEVDVLSETIATLAAEAERRGGSGVDSKEETDAMMKIVQELESRLDDALKKVSVAEKSDESMVAMKNQLDKLKDQDTALISSLKDFLLERGLISEGQANMLVMGTAPEVLQSIVTKSEEPVKQSRILKAAQAKVAKLEAIVAEKDEEFERAKNTWKKERTSMQQQLDSQQSTLEMMQASIKALEMQAASSAATISKLEGSMGQKRVPTGSQSVSSGNDEAVRQLQQKLDARSAELATVRKEAESKLDAAKTIAKDLNARLLNFEREYASREAELLKTIDALQVQSRSKTSESPRKKENKAKASSTNRVRATQLKAKAKSSPNTSSVSLVADKDSLLSELKSLKAYQIDKKSKSDLQLYLVALGIEQSPDGASLDSLKKKELAAILKPVIA